MSGVHVTGSCILCAHRPPQCGHLSHSDGQQQQQHCFAASFMDALCCCHVCWSLNESPCKDLCAVNPPLPPCCPPDHCCLWWSFVSLWCSTFLMIWPPQRLVLLFPLHLKLYLFAFQTVTACIPPPSENCLYLDLPLSSLAHPFPLLSSNECIDALWGLQ